MLEGVKKVVKDIRFTKTVVTQLAQFRKAEKNHENVGKLFDKIAEKTPNKVCFYFNDEQWTFKKVQDTSNKIGNYFASEGLSKGDSISLFMENRPQYICTWLGLSKIGVIPALINYNLRSKSLKHSIDVAKSKGIIYGTELSPAVRELYPGGSKEFPLYASGLSTQNEIESKDLDSLLSSVTTETPSAQKELDLHDNLFYIYTSGTTGLPKASIIKHARFFTISVMPKCFVGATEDDVVYCTLPLYHSSGGILGVGQAIVNGSSLVIRNKFSATNFWKDCINYKVTWAQYMGETCRYLLRTPKVPEETQHNLKLILGNGLRPEIWKEFVERFKIPRVCEFYGSTEGNANLINVDNKFGASGYIPGTFAKHYPLTLFKLDESGDVVRDKTGLAVKCEPNEVGELMAKIIKNHPTRDFKGYASDEAANKKKILNDVFEKGDSAFRTGDLFTKDADGNYFFRDRMGDTFRWKGENVSSAEVEYVISNIAGLKDAVVFGVKIPNRDGQAGMVVIADPEGTLNLNELSEQITKQLPHYARPVFLRITPQIEITGTHKMMKTDLQKAGFDLKNTKDKIYFFKEGKYVQLDQQLYEEIINDKLKF